MPRKICYVTGTRADYGLMASTLRAIASHPSLSLSLLVTCMHLSPRHGLTVREIEADGLFICGRIATPVEHASGASMARGIGMMLQQFVDVFEATSPAIVLLMGDRGEMLAGAVAAIHLDIPVVHIHGGERSGTVDEPIRHAISKLSHWHCVATAQSHERLVRMGENPRHIIVTGAPGLDGLTKLAIVDRVALCRSADFDPAKPVALMVFHPVLQEAATAGNQASNILDSLEAAGLQVVALMPNADAGGDIVRATLAHRAATRNTQVRVFTHLPRREFVSWMATSDIMIGNSSSGIIEAGSFGTPVINVGIRQNLRERNSNVLDVAPERNALDVAIAAALAGGRLRASNIYGDGNAGTRIVELLASLQLSPDILLKANAY